MYFDNARKGKKSDQIYQIDPQENTEAESKDPRVSETKMPKHDISESEALNASEALRLRHDHRSSREEDEMRRLTDSPMRHESGGQRNSSNLPRQPYSTGETLRRVGRQSVGSDRSSDHSPLHPHSRIVGKSSGISSPSWDRKATSDRIHGLAPSTPGRSRLRSVTRGDDSPDRGPAVPKFGEWDETDPAAAEGFTQVFDRVREEKHNETGKVPVMLTETISHSSGHKHYANDNAKGCGCFPWAKR